MATNAAMGITGLILGLKPVPEISLQEYIPPMFAIKKTVIDHICWQCPHHIIPPFNVLDCRDRLVGDLQPPFG